MSLAPVKAAEAPRKFDLAIVGAGPAGMAAAITARHALAAQLLAAHDAAEEQKKVKAAQAVTA